jgi:hypothetical protein
MIFLLGALTVAGADATGRPSADVMTERLRAAGVVVREDEEVHVTFSIDDAHRRAAEIEVPGADGQATCQCCR